MRTSLLLIALVLLLASCGGGGGGTTHPAPIVTPPVDDGATILDIASSVTYDNYEVIDGVEYRHSFVTFTNTSTLPLRFRWGWKEHTASGGITTFGATSDVTLDPGESKMQGVGTYPVTSEITIVMKYLV